MKSLAIAIAEHDPAVAHAVKSSLDRYVRSVLLAQSLSELRTAIQRYRVDAVIVDLETVPLEQIAEISRQTQVPVICTHRIPNDEIWTAAMEAGAADVCASADTNGIALSLHRNVRPSARSTAA